MLIRFDEKTDEIKMVMEDSDIANFKKVRGMTDSEGWRLVTQYHGLVRESIIEAGKNAAKKSGKDDVCAKRFAMLAGLDQWMLSINRFVEMIDEFEKSEVN